MLDTFAKYKQQRLKGFIVWLPMVPGDSAEKAAGLVAEDPRVLAQGWDGDRSIGQAFAKTLQLHRPAWDVYLIYEPAARWVEDVPPSPSFWMHQLSGKSGANPDLRLDPVMFEKQVGKKLKALDGAT